MPAVLRITYFYALNHNRQFYRGTCHMNPAHNNNDMAS